jgi:microcystin degradation protein MlrC
VNDTGKAKRVAVLGMHLESNAFAPVCRAEAFRSNCYLVGDDIVADARAANFRQPAEIPGFFREMDRLGVAWKPVPILVTAAEPSGPCDQRFLDATLGEMRRRLMDAGRLDGVYFSAHGGMTATGSEDPDGDLFAMVRDVVGPKVPLIATLDLHANVSGRMVETTDVLISYVTNPHVDQQERAAEAARAMVEIWGGMKPETAFIRLPIVAPTVTLLTAQGPYADLINYGREAKAGAILNVSVVAGFAFSDLKKNGLAVLVTARDDKGAARRLAEDIAQRAWAMRHRFQKRLTSLEDAVARAVRNGEDRSLPPLILADVADNPGGGGSGNTTWLLKALHEAGAKGVILGVFYDPKLALAAHEQGKGAAFMATFNSAGETEFAKRFQAPVKVVALSDGACVGRRGLWAGRAMSIGKAALLDVGGFVQVVVVSVRKQCADPVMFEMFGLDIARARTVVVKSRGHFRAGFDEFFGPDQVIEVDAPGLTSPVLSRFAFKNLPRPVFPLDQDAYWEGPRW